MRFRDLFSSLFGQGKAIRDNDLRIPKFGGSRPHGHFREFTVPRRYQRGGVQLSAAKRTPPRCPNRIIPCAGENIP